MPRTTAKGRTVGRVRSSRMTALPDSDRESVTRLPNGWETSRRTWALSVEDRSLRGRRVLMASAVANDCRQRRAVLRRAREKFPLLFHSSSGYQCRPVASFPFLPSGGGPRPRPAEKATTVQPPNRRFSLRQRTDDKFDFRPKEERSTHVRTYK